MPDIASCRHDSHSHKQTALALPSDQMADVLKEVEEEEAKEEEKELASEREHHEEIGAEREREANRQQEEENELAQQQQQPDHVLPPAAPVGAGVHKEKPCEAAKHLRRLKKEHAEHMHDAIKDIIGSIISKASDVSLLSQDALAKPGQP
ncbi:unnamed protein product [Vitrella brassicaformis CCMP3155]|uniref:Uncharacterized protein n=1 Tax=Vitrella brassicaformis (strain CCMP3155) TaxID=1169540 RepID=A0A0G4EV96_VITBC|nr:unnamed protein product [Vitrella brassicaformis CCMP3155]|eukprot:CEM02541.1 unnamed protein product [Vitrella brassicaformis CCMP3155]